MTPPAGRLRPALVLITAFLGWMFAGQTMSMHQLFVRPVLLDFMGQGLTGEPATKPEVVVGKWMAWYTVAFLLGAAAGGALFGWLGDRFGRARAMGWSILCYSVFTGLGYWSRNPWDLWTWRFLACLGVGGIWPNGVALVAEVWSDVSRPWLAGLIGAAANIGFVLFALLAWWQPITPDSWRWIFLVGAAPILLGVISLAFVPESPRWLAQRDQRKTKDDRSPLAEILGPELRYATIIGILLGTVPIVGNWGGNNWITPWADEVAGAANPTHKAIMQMTRSSGATIGSLVAGWLAGQLGRRTTYFSISLACLLVSSIIYHWLTPLDALFPAWVFVLGIVGVAYFGWLPLYLPELFPTRVRSTGAGVAFNFGRILAVPCVLGAGAMHSWFEGDYARVGQITSLVYAAGMVIACLAPDTSGKKLKD